MHTATKGSKINISSEKKLGEFANNLSSKLKQGDIFFLFLKKVLSDASPFSFFKFLLNFIQL